VHLYTLLFITHYGICLDIIRHTKTLFNVLHDSYTIEHHHVQKSLLASHALTYCDILYIFHAYNYTGIVTCTASLEFPHSPDAQICIAMQSYRFNNIKIITIIFRDIRPDNLKEKCP
jgi:hypothetical protein